MFVRKELRRCILQQIQVWVTFADQLAPFHKKDQELLNEVFKYLINKLSINKEKKTQESVDETDIHWKILFVGWDKFCRSTFQQIDVLKLALSYSSSEMETMTSKDADAFLQAQMSSLQEKKFGQQIDEKDSNCGINQ